MPLAISPNQDRTEYQAPDGVKYLFSSPAFLIQEDGYGMPPVEYVTRRGPYQHGETVLSMFLRPRVIQVIMRRNGCSRAEYWNLRNALMDVLRPFRTPGTTPRPGIWRKYLANGGIREFDVFATEGPGFASHDPAKWDEWSIQDTIRFTAYDPVARDPRIHAQVYTASGTGGTFPLTFPIQFSGLGSTGTSIAVAGTWQTYPVMVLTGPLSGPLIRNLTTGEKIELGATLVSGQVLTIDLAYGVKTVMDNSGTNYIGYVSSDSDISTFHLVPGINNMQVYATSTTPASSIALQWYERYIGY